MPSVWDTPLGKAKLDEIAKAQPKRAAKQKPAASRMYASAKSTRSSGNFGSSETSADSELASSLQAMRSRSRQLCRDASYAKRAKNLVVNNVVGSGIGMQAQVKGSRGELRKNVNDEIEKKWGEWCRAENCHTGGRLNFQMLERALMAQTFEAGEVLVRERYDAFGPMDLPYALELIEAEKIADDISGNGPGMISGNHLRLGVECNEFYRAVAYYLRKRHRSEIGFAETGTNWLDRVPADSIIHLAIIDRWPQTRGEPWMHTAAMRLNDMDGYIEAELVKARSQSARVGIIETPEDSASFGEEQEDGSTELTMDPDSIFRLNPGESWKDSAPTSPNPNMEAFMRYMIREMAAATGVSYESLSRDYSQSNYSSSRLALLDDRDVWRLLQTWFLSSFRQRVHRNWLRQAVMSGQITSISIREYAADPAKFEAVLFKPRGWSWIDPTKEVEAYKEAIKSGMTTLSDVISQTANGQDLEDVLSTRSRELELMKEAGLVFETSPEIYTADAKKATADAKAAAKPPDDPPNQAPKVTNAPPKAGRFILETVK